MNGPPLNLTFAPVAAEHFEEMLGALKHSVSNRFYQRHGFTRPAKANGTSTIAVIRHPARNITIRNATANPAASGSTIFLMTTGTATPASVQEKITTAATGETVRP